MKIIHISTRDTGGAAVACIRLHQALLSEGYDSTLLTLRKERSDIPSHYLYETTVYEKLKLFTSRLLNRISKTFNIKSKIEISTDSFSFPQSIYKLHNHKLVKESDIINLHWISGFWDYRSFSKLKSKKIIWTLHDMNPFTGGCHYSNNCTRYLDACSDCPFISKAKKDITKANLKYKSKWLINNLTIVAPSEWLKECSQSSKLFGRLKHFHVLYTILPDSNAFLNQKNARANLNLPLNSNILLFVTDSIKIKRKGFDILEQALYNIDPSNYLLLVVGNNSSKFADGISTNYLGYINDNLQLSTIYAAADVCIVPSLEDNLPNTIIEALISGTPVICFNVGGAKDLIIDQVNGLISDKKTPESLSEMIIAFFRNKNKFLRNKIRNSTIEKFNNKVIVEKYIHIYNS